MVLRNGIRYKLKITSNLLVLSPVFKRVNFITNWKSKLALPHPISRMRSSVSKLLLIQVIIACVKSGRKLRYISLQRKHRIRLSNVIMYFFLQFHFLYCVSVKKFYQKSQVYLNNFFTTPIVTNVAVITEVL